MYVCLYLCCFAVHYRLLLFFFYFFNIIPARMRRDSGNQLLEELEQLSHTLYPTTRRTASLALPRDSSASSLPPPSSSTSRPRSRRLSLSPWRSRPKHETSFTTSSSTDHDQNHHHDDDDTSTTATTLVNNKKGAIWNWKPIRALTHIGKQKLSCLFSIDVVTAQGLPPSMNGLRLSVCVRKKETKDGAVNTMPSRVSQGAADFEETLFFRCHVYCTASGKYLEFEPRPFLIYLYAVDARELDLGKNEVNLSQLIQESVDKSLEGTQLRQWDFTFNLSGKAKGGELVLTMRFQIMEKDGGIGIYRQAEAIKTGGGQNKNPSSSALARKQSKASFSIPSPRLMARAGPRTPSKPHSDHHLQGIDELNLDEPAPPSSVSSGPQKKKVEEDIDTDIDPPEFEIVDKGVEISKKERGDDDYDQGIAADEDKPTSSEVVKEVLLEQIHMTRLTELDSIAQQIKALESMMVERKVSMKDEDTESQRLDAEEENVTREFLQMLEDEEDELNEFQLDQQHYHFPQIQPDHQRNCDVAECDTKVYLSDLGKGLGCVVQTRDGGYLAAMNPLDAAVARKDTPKLAMQISKPMVLASSNNSVSGFEVFQKMAAMGIEGLRSQISSHVPPMDELMGKTAEQIAFEGIASAIIQGRKREEGGGGASSSAARTVAMVKTMGAALNAGRKERISTGIWSTANDNPLTVDEILAFSLQKIEAMAVEALKIQAEISEEEAPFQVSWHNGKAVVKGENSQQLQPLASAIPLEDWIRDQQRESRETVTLVVVVQLRDPVRRYEAVGGPVLALIHATTHDDDDDDGEKRYKVTSLHAGGLKVNERQRLTAMQWLVAYGLGKAAAGKKSGKQAVLSKGQDVFWSMSSRVMADMWLKPIRNPDIKFAT